MMTEVQGDRMLDPESQQRLKATIQDCIKSDSEILNALRQEIRPLKNATKKIQPRAATSIALVATDGGNNKLQFDPFLIQLVRVVDSSQNEYCLEAISPTTSIEELSKRQFRSDGSPATPLGELMAVVDAKTLTELSPMIKLTADGSPVSPRWVEVYRELVEWAIVLSLMKRDFGTDTIIICDGFLRSLVFAKGRFQLLLREMSKRIDDKWKSSKRRIYLTGIAKHSQVLTRYRLALALEQVLKTDYPAYVEVPREIEEKAYLWGVSRGDSKNEEGDELNKFVGGRMFLVKFGSRPNDPVWPVDIFTDQIHEAQAILGHMLADAINGFPVPHYPRCLQKAHEHAALVDFDFDILQDYIVQGIRNSLGENASTLDSFRLQDADPSQKRYN